MRGFALLFLLLPLACGRGGEQRSEGLAPNDPRAAAGGLAEDGLIDCATGGATVFVHACAMERHGADLMFLSPTGGFRRVRISPGGKIESADGSAGVRAAEIGRAQVELEIGGDRFRLRRSAVR